LTSEFLSVVGEDHALTRVSVDPKKRLTRHILALAALTAIGFAGYVGWSYASCHATWSDTGWKYRFVGPLSGCQVSVEGAWLPHRSVRVFWTPDIAEGWRKR
jgi:hypothetical protein